MGKQKFNLWKKNVYLSDCIQIDNLDNQKITLLNPNDKSIILYTDKENDKDMAFSILKEVINMKVNLKIISFKER